MLDFDISPWSITTSLLCGDIQLAENILGIRYSSSLGSYLGSPLGLGSKVRDFKLIRDKILAKLELWKAKNLSLAGKVTLIKSTIVVATSYYMQCLRFPKSVCSHIDKAVRNFFWFEPDKDKKMHLIGWQEICLDKYRGGLGIPDFSARNSAFLAKLCWRAIMHPQEPWAKVCNHRLALKSGSNSSVLGKGLLVGLSIWKKGAFKI